MNNNSNNKKWWKSTKSSMYQDVFAHLNYLENNQRYREDGNLRHARLYGNDFIRGLGLGASSAANSAQLPANRISLNVIQSIIDTMVSKITKNKPRPLFLTDGGDWSIQRKAKKLTKFMDGVFSGSNFYTKATMAFLDSCIFGTGCMKILQKNGAIEAERVFINEIKVSDAESYYSDPMQMHQVKYIHRDILKEMFPNQSVMIDQAGLDALNTYNTTYENEREELIMVVESWHLPSGPEAKDGRHAICIDNLTLLDEKYTKDYFPFIFFRWSERPVGFFGSGIAEQLQGIQLEINKILRTIQVSMHLVSVPKLLVEASSKIVSSHLNNKIGGIIKYAGTPPNYASLGQIPGELFSHLEFLYQKAYEISGISQLSAQSLKPSGLDSGKALREYNDLETERFLSVAARYETAFMNASKIIVDMAKDIYKTNKDFKVKAKGEDFIETIKWADVDLKEDQFMMDVFPTSSLSRNPAGRLQDIQELMEAGFLDKQYALKLLDFPDLKSEMNMMNSDAQNLDKIIERMVDEGVYFPPEPYQNLENAVRKVQQAYLMYRMRGLDEDKLDLLRRYMEDSQSLLLKAQESVPTTPQQVDQLAARGAAGAAQQVAEQANLGAEPLNPLVEGGIDLSNLPVEEEVAMEDEAAAAEQAELEAAEQVV